MNGETIFQNSTLRYLFSIIGAAGVLLGIYFAVLRPSVSAEVNAAVKLERVVIDQEISTQRMEHIQQLEKNAEEHRQIEGRLEKRLDRMELKLDAILERSIRADKGK